MGKHESGFGSNDDIKLAINGNKVITYSRAVDVILSRVCRNSCGYCGFAKKKEKLLVPYSTISIFKKARKLGAREASLISGERPDKYNYISAKFDVWGFNSYMEYIYTVAELAFLEGLLVNLNIGYLSFNEMKYLQEIAASLEITLESIGNNDLAGVHKFSPSKSTNVRLKFLENTGRLNFPVNTGILIGIGESPEDRMRILLDIQKMQEEYGNIQSVKISTYIPQEGTPSVIKKTAGYDDLLATISLAREILPESVDITAPINIFQDIMDLINHGVTDLGQIKVLGDDYLFPDKKYPNLDTVQETLINNGYELYKRLPIKNNFILSQKYSKKIGQLLDKYKLKLKESSKEENFLFAY